MANIGYHQRIMSQLLLVDNDRIRDVEDIQAAEEILKLRNKGDHWGVIDALVKLWLNKTPEEAQAYKIELADTKETLYDPKFGQTKGGKHQERRLTLIFPQRLMNMIRSLYKPEELGLDEEFYKEFLQRYPGFRVSEGH